jgi:hypothetical protein
MGNRRMPEDIPGGYNYIVRTDNYLQLVPLVGPTNGARLGLPGSDVTEWHTIREGLDPIYLKWSDDSQKTKPLNKQMVNLLKGAWIFVEPRLNTVAASTSIIETDETVFNLVGDANHADPTHRVVAITQQLFGNLTGIGGGIMAGHVRPVASAKRNHIFADADGVAIFYTITAAPTLTIDPATAISKVFTKANFLLELGLPVKGQYINYLMGWNYSKNTKLNGPLCSAQSELIV